MHMDMHIQMHMQMLIHILLRIDGSTYVYMHGRIHMHLSQLHRHIHIHIYVYMYANMCVWMCINICNYTYACSTCIRMLYIHTTVPNDTATPSAGACAALGSEALQRSSFRSGRLARYSSFSRSARSCGQELWPQRLRWSPGRHLCLPK